MCSELVYQMTVTVSSACVVKYLLHTFHATVGGSRGRYVYVGGQNNMSIPVGVGHAVA
jgi:hypothetical protein